MPGYELGWDDEITHEEREFIVLPDGDYDFEVVDFERGRHQGSANLPPCNMATLQIRIESEHGTKHVFHRLFLHTKTQGFLSEFFVGIGQMKKGETATMQWNAVVGSKGRCRLGIRTWTGDDGKERKDNEIKRFYAPEEYQPTPQQQPQQQTTYQAGSF